MAVSPHNSLRSNKAKSGIPFVDSSNHTSTKQKQKQKHHAHLRSSSASSSLRKSPPTCTLSLASVSAGPALSLPFPVAIPLPLSAPSSGVPFPSDDGNDAGSCGDAGGPLPEPWRRPRARTSHVETPRRAQPPPKPRRISKPLGASSSPGVSTSTPRPTPTPADLRLAALVERSIAHRLADAHSPLDELDVQDALLAVRLRALLALHGRRVRPASPTTSGFAITPSACAPSVLLSGSSGLDAELTVLSSPPAAATPAPLRFIPACGRARSGSRGSINNATALSMPALVATLLIRRHEGRRAGTFTFPRPGQPRSYASRTPSPLAVWPPDAPVLPTTS